MLTVTVRKPRGSEVWKSYGLEGRVRDQDADLEALLERERAFLKRGGPSREHGRIRVYEPGSRRVRSVEEVPPPPRYPDPEVSHG